MMGFPDGASGKEPACQCRRHERRVLYPSVGKVPWRRAWQPSPVLLPGESRGRRSLEGTVYRVAKSQTGLKRLSTHARVNDSLEGAFRISAGQRLK